MGTYVNNLRLLEITTGDESGTWGTKTNTNLELIADAFGSGTEAITTNADTHTTTIADGAADEGRAIFLKYTGTLDSACTITIAPNTVNKLWFIENATSGSQNIIISQGSGANITIGNGNVAAVYTDGAGSGAAVLDAFADLELSSTLTVAGNVDFNGDLDVDGTANLDVVDIDGAVDMASTLQVDGAITSSAGATITIADNNPALTLTSTDADANTGPNIKLYRNSGSPADNDHIGEINFEGRNDNSQDVVYANIESRIKDASDGSEDGYFDFETMVAGTLSSRLIMNETTTVFNEDSLDLDFRVEGNGEANLLFVDAGNDEVGIGTNTPDGRLDVTHSQNATSNFYLQNPDTTDTSSRAYLNIVSGNRTLQLGAINADHAYINAPSGANLYFQDGGSTNMTIEADGTVNVGGDWLDVADGVTTIGGTDTSKLQFHNAAGTLRSFLTLNGTSLEIDTDSALIFSPNNSERARIDDSGRLGLGTASPHSYYSGSNKFVIANTSGSTGMTFATSNTGQARIDFAEGTSGAEQYRGTISYNHAATESEGYLRFVAGGAEALRLGSNYVLMGNLPTSDPGVDTALYNDSGTLKISAG